MIKLSYNEYYDKVLGGWTGKCLGGTVGRFEGTKEITDFNIFELLPEGMVPNDDLDIQLIWLDVLLNKGIHLTSTHLMEAWLRQYPFDMAEYGYSRRNSRRGVMPPISGVYANDFYKTGMGCPIRAEVWGMICPGDPELAAVYAYNDACLDHEGESVWAEQFLSAMEAAAFFESDICKLIDIGLKFVPFGSRLHRIVLDVIHAYEKGLTWKKAWKMLRDHHSHPDCTYAPMNMGIITMSILYGGGSMEKTLSIAVNSGWDVDCTCATSAALLGIVLGKKGIDIKLIEKMGDKVLTDSKVVNPMDDLAILTEYTCRAGITLMKEGMLSISISDVPAGLQSVPVTDHRQDIEFSIDYQGAPAIGYMKSKQITVSLTNNSKVSKSGMLKFNLPEGWTVDVSNIQISLTASNIKNICYTITVPEDVEIISETNILNLTFTSDSGEEWSHNFGLIGVPECRVLGPFFDSYKDWLDEEMLPEDRYLTTPSFKIAIPSAGEEWCNHRIDPNKEYISEDFTDISKVRELFAGGIRTGIYNDNYEIKQVFGMQGPSCCYFLQELHSPEDRTALLVTGSTDPCKVWLNGKMVHSQDVNRFWLPNNETAVVNLKRGANHIIIKAVRTGAENTLSLIFRKFDEKIKPEHDLTPILSDFYYSTR